MHDTHTEINTLLWFIYIVSNAAIALGYGAMPALVLPYLPLTRRVLAFGAGFFALCGLTHAGMVFGHRHVPMTWFWAIEHLFQAIATWGFIVTFHMLLRRANQRREQGTRLLGRGRGQLGDDTTTTTTTTTRRGGDATTDVVTHPDDTTTTTTTTTSSADPGASTSGGDSGGGGGGDAS